MYWYDYVLIVAVHVGLFVFGFFFTKVSLHILKILKGVVYDYFKKLANLF